MSRARGQVAGIDWDSEKRLGVVSDYALAPLLGVAVGSVRSARASRGIPSVGASRRKPQPDAGQPTLVEAMLAWVPNDALLAEVRRRMGGAK